MNIHLELFVLCLAASWQLLVWELGSENVYCFCFLYKTLHLMVEFFMERPLHTLTSRFFCGGWPCFIFYKTAFLIVSVYRVQYNRIYYSFFRRIFR